MFLWKYKKITSRILAMGLQLRPLHHVPFFAHAEIYPNYLLNMLLDINVGDRISIIQPIRFSVLFNISKISSRFSSVRVFESKKYMYLHHK